MYIEDLSTGVGVLEKRARLAQLSIYAYIAIQLASFGMRAHFLLSPAPNQTVLGLADTVDRTASLVFIASAVANSFWINRAHHNLRLFSAGPFQFSAQSAVGWFFVPFANLVQPFLAMRELWMESRGQAAVGAESTRMVDGWWACFIIGGLLSSIGGRMVAAENSPETQITALAVFDFGELLRLGSAILLHEIIREVDRMQGRRVMVGEVFE